MCESLHKFSESWVYDYICETCSKSYHKYIDNIIEQDIKNNIVPSIYKRYKLRLTYKRVKNKLVKILTYLIDRSILDDADIICNTCVERCKHEKKDVTILTTMLYKSVMITKIFSIMISEDYLEESKLLMQRTPSLKTTINNKLISFRNHQIQYPIDYYWKGSEYYYKKLFGISSLLDTIIPLDIYSQRTNLFLNDAICGHPMASHGWFQEGLSNLIDMDIIDD